MTAQYRRHHGAWTVALTALLSIVLFLTIASAVGLGLAQADTVSASGSSAQPSDAAKGDNDIFSRRTPESLQPYYHRVLLPLVMDRFYPYRHATASAKNYLVGVFTFGGIFTCVLLGLVVLARRK
jgi:hypothetical protein